jgi:transcriptional regulator with GAF, ATPase, and Fis domain
MERADRAAAKLAAPRFQLLGELGSGSTSRVFLAEDAESGCEVALKIGHSAERGGLLADEAERLVFAEAPGLPRVLDAGWTDPHTFAVNARATEHARLTEHPLPYLALEYVRGDALLEAARVSAERAELACIVARDVGAVLADLHAAGLAHGDVKPSNVLVEGAGSAQRRARLVDLGLAAVVDEAVPRGGTRRYLAPELTESARSDARGRDLWALALTIAETAAPELLNEPHPAAAVRARTWPRGLSEVLLPLLEARPEARPDARWVARWAERSLGTRCEREDRVLRDHVALARAYRVARRTELLAAARASTATIELAEPARGWVEHALVRLRRVQLLRGTAPHDHVIVRDMSARDRRRWLIAAVGTAASHWPSLPDADGELAALLWERSRSTPLRELGAPEATSESEPPDLTDPVAVALELRNPRPTASALDAAEELLRRGVTSLGLALGEALRRRGELGRALWVFSQLEHPRAPHEAAECARRARDLEGAERWLARGVGANPEIAALGAAIRARVALDRGDLAGARAHLDGARSTPAVLEVSALLALREGHREAARELAERGLSQSNDDERTARLEAVLGNVLHASGEHDAAREAFQRAANRAARSGAALEEASYWTGLAAAAAHLGRAPEAVDAADRAALVFAALGRPLEAGRAALVSAATYAALGARAEALDAADRALRDARSARDRVCQAYAHLACADVLRDARREALEHVERARLLLGEAASPEDRLRVAARAAPWGTANGAELRELDAWAASPACAQDARLEWWIARATRALLTSEIVGATFIVQELQTLAHPGAPLLLRGPACYVGAELAARLGEGERARGLAQLHRQAVREWLERLPSAWRARAQHLAWVAAGQDPDRLWVTPDQVSDLDRLVRSLGRRDRLRPLLDQVLDALLLWTGVERGLLLLRAPGGRLVPRAARNLARVDLTREQLALSHSLAERALELGEPVVAVDATGELPDLHASVHALKLRSVLAVPLISAGEAIGVVYLDDRVRRGAFGRRELDWVKLVASLAGVALADARDQLLLRRAARRARRAEQQLSQSLARRETELEVAERELARARSARDTRFAYTTLIGESEPMRSLKRLLDRVAASEVPVLVSGESGTGKELVARAIHDHGPRGARPFVTENCGAIPEPLLESALFGHVRGAFTGALRPRAGLFEVAHQGTLFLDEIGEMSPALQTKLLRVLQSGELRPVGSERVRQVDVRVIAATHRDLGELVKQGRFREDLYYRLDVINVRVPPLRERPGDVAQLAQHFLGRHAPGRRVELEPQALARLTGFSWPGNVRQLENEIRRALVLADDRIGIEHLSREIAEASGGEAPPRSPLHVRDRVDGLERELVREALERTAGNQTRAAELLGLSRFGLQKMMKRLGIDPSPRSA